jgi:hypothetical protein
MVVLIDDIQINGISIVRDGVGLLTQIRDELGLSFGAFPSNLDCGFPRPRLPQERQAVAADRRRTSHGCLGMVIVSTHPGLRIRLECERMSDRFG